MGNASAKGYGDFRKMFDNKEIQGVVVSTPDHWHALITILACAAGKDVYVEKPMTVFIDEGHVRPAIPRTMGQRTQECPQGVIPLESEDPLLMK